ncbi:MAG: BCCT family transporter, partial [Eubacterium sp.]
MQNDKKENQKKEKLKKNDDNTYNVKMDKTIYFTSLIVIVAVCSFCIIFPEPALYAVEAARKFVVTKFDWFFLLLGLVVIILSIFVGASRFGKIRLSENGEKPEFGFWSWLFMIYFSAIGSSTLMWAICEPMEYLIKPPFGFEPFSEQAFDMSIVYGLFHWGPIAWAFFAFSGLVVAYYFY